MWKDLETHHLCLAVNVSGHQFLTDGMEKFLFVFDEKKKT
jgi:hypothetical protein